MDENILLINIEYIHLYLPYLVHKEIIYENIAMLVEQGIDYAICGYLLLTTMNKGDIRIVKLLTDYGIDPNVSSWSDETPLMIASRCGDYDIVEFLLIYGVDIDAQYYDGNTALILSAIHNNSSVVDLLIEYGADKDIKNRNGDTITSIMSKNYEREFL